MLCWAMRARAPPRAPPVPVARHVGEVAVAVEVAVDEARLVALERHRRVLVEHRRALLLGHALPDDHVARLDVRVLRHEPARRQLAVVVRLHVARRHRVRAAEVLLLARRVVLVVLLVERPEERRHEHAVLDRGAVHDHPAERAGNPREPVRCRCVAGGQLTNSPPPPSQRTQSHSRVLLRARAGPDGCWDRYTMGDGLCTGQANTGPN